MFTLPAIEVGVEYKVFIAAIASAYPSGFHRAGDETSAKQRRNHRGMLGVSAKIRNHRAGVAQW